MSETRTEECAECQTPVPYVVVKRQAPSSITTGNRQGGPVRLEPEAEKPFVNCPNCKTRYRVKKVLGGFTLEKQ